MLSMSISPGIKACPSFPCQNPNVGPLKTPYQFDHQTSSLQFSIIFYRKSRPIRRIDRISALAAAIAETPTDTTIPDDTVTVQEAEKLKVVVKAMEKPRLVLKFIWMEKNIGLGLDQVIPGHGSIPLSPYFFWPMKDAWEELKTTLESKPWISQKKMIILLNQATDIINLWQQSGGNLT